jgi:pimeloyl-ACP methyl ester carboxylesterase
MRSERFTTPALDGVTLHALHRGDPTRVPLVLLHGGGANAHWWDAVAPALAERFHVVALDFRGHGDSDHPSRRETGAFQHDLSALLDHLGSPRAILMGHSMGGHVAIRHAASCLPEARPRALVAVEVARGGGLRERRRMRLALAARRTYATREEAVARFRFLPPAPHADEATRRRVAEHSVRCEGERFGFKFDPAWFRVPPAPRPDLSRISSPTLIVRGEESTLLTLEGAGELAREIGDARIGAIPDAGHNVHVERPEAFLAAVFPFLDGALAEAGSAEEGR